MTLGPIDEEGIREMQERYEALEHSDKKIVEEEEDKLLSTLIYNFTAYMIMMEVNIISFERFRIFKYLYIKDQRKVVIFLYYNIVCFILRYQRAKS